MEEEVRDILRAALKQDPVGEKGLGSLIRARFAPLGGVELEIPTRGPMREPPHFD